MLRVLYHLKVLTVNFNRLRTLTIAGIIIFLCLLSYRLGQGDQVIIEKTVEVEVYDKGFCVSCYKAHNWDKMYIMMNNYTDSIHNTNLIR